MDDLNHQPLCETYAKSPLRSGTIWVNNALMNLWIVYHDGYRHASMQEDVLLGIRVTVVYCNLENNFFKSICMMVHHAICGNHEQKKS